MMRSSRWSRLAAGTVFVLIAAVVITGMTWASSSSLALAKKNVTDEQRTQLNQALLEMTGYMAGILNSEAARDYTDYKAIHSKRPLLIHSRGNVELNAEYADFLSPLAATGPPHDWMDLNFQVSPDGVLTSPQFPDQTRWFAHDPFRFVTPPTPHARRVWEWLKTSLPSFDLNERVAQVCRCRTRASATRPSVRATVAQSDSRDAAPSRSEDVRSVEEYEQTKQSLRDAQVKYLPAPACEDARIAARNIRNVGGAFASNQSEDGAPPGGDVETRPDPFATFWLGKGPDGVEKLAFVREVHSDAALFYQGFIGDWARLKPELLKQVHDPIDGADLVPITDEARTGSSPTSAPMPNLPVRLIMPDIPGGAAAAAWRDVRGTLITIWAVTAGALVVAGLGLRNLVALTERRMQFAYAVTHELRTPLTTFRLYSDMLSAGLVPDSSKQEYVDTLNRESLRLSKLVEGVLEYARLENQKVKLNPSDTDGPTLLNLIVENLRTQCEKNGIEPLAENHLSNGERLRTDIDVVNRIAGVLVNNACRHARGSESASVLVHLGAENGKVQVDVVDSGPGIDRADARAIFRPFRRGRKADNAAQGGIGLGLALARNWAALLGGTLELAARHHPRMGGAHFRLTIPAR